MKTKKRATTKTLYILHLFLALMSLGLMGSSTGELPNETNVQIPFCVFLVFSVSYTYSRMELSIGSRFNSSSKSVYG